MKVLIQSRKDFYSLPGGDTIQIMKTKKELEKLGVEVDVSLEFTPDLSNYDLVHLTNVTRIQETYMHVKNAINQNKPIVLSTIFWPMDEFEKKGQIGLRKFVNSNVNIDLSEKIKAFAKFIKNKNFRNESTKNLWKIGYTNMQNFVVNNVDYFLPNSEMEMNIFCQIFNLPKLNYTVIPNAIDSDIVEQITLSNNKEEFMKYKDAIICVGRIEPRKNQLNLVKALDGSNYKLLLVGAVSDNQKKYFKEVKKYIDKNDSFYYIPFIENHDLYELYKLCKVSTLPSWLDTPGLVSLEAGVMGCNLAISSKGSTTEYFRDYADYCLPDDLGSIRSAIENAMNKEKNDNLKKLILDNYTWKIAAKKTLDSYKVVLKNNGSRG